MAKKVKVVPSLEVVTPEVAPAVESKTEEVKVAPVEKKAEYPAVQGSGKFQAVPFEDGAVVYNPAGQRATGKVSKDKAEDIVREQNRAAQL